MVRPMYIILNIVTIKDNMDSPHSPTKLSGIMRCNPKVIPNDIMETTIYNIISEAVYGETDLTEKTRIYFFNK